MLRCSLIIKLLFFSINAQSQWVQTAGPTGGPSLEIVANNDSIFVNGTQGGIFRSPDHGVSWERVLSDTAAATPCLMLRLSGQNLYAVYAHAIYLSKDNGNSWATMPNPLGDADFNSIETNGDEIFAGGSNGGLYYSPDNGINWSHLDSGIPSAVVNHLLYTNDKLWLGTSLGLFFSVDKGHSWENVLPDMTWVNTIYQSDNKLWVGGASETSGVIFFSNDAGVSWSVPNIGNDDVRVLGISAHGNNIYFSTETNYVYHSADEGLSWSPIQVDPFLYGLRTNLLTRILHYDNQLFLSYGAGILHSANNGADWSERNSEYTNQTNLKVKLTNDAVIALAEQNGLFSMNLNGTSWSRSSNEPHLTYPTAIHTYQNNIVAGASTNFVLVRLADSEDWEMIYAASAPDESFKALSGHKNNFIISCSSGTYHFTDLGTDRKFLSKADIGQDATPVLNYLEGDTMVIATNQKLFASRDLGKSWSKKNLPIASMNPTGIAFMDSFLFVTSYHGIYVSNNLGGSWNRICTPVDTITDIKANGKFLFISTSEGMFRTDNLGNTWLPIGENFRQLIFSFDIGPSHTYAGTYGQSVWMIGNEELMEDRPANVPPLKIPELTSNCNSIHISNYAGETVRWYVNDMLIPGESGSSIIVGQSATYHVEMDMVCGAMLSNKVAMKIPGSLPAPIVVKHCESVTLAGMQKGVSVAWFHGSDLISSDTILHNPVPGSYRVEYTLDCYIPSETTFEIRHPEEVPVYNFISPNDDGINDKYQLSEELSGSSFSVFNRWGELVYKNEHYDNTWIPQELATGIYLYLIKNPCYGNFSGTLTIQN